MAIVAAMLFLVRLRVDLLLESAKFSARLEVFDLTTNAVARISKIGLHFWREFCFWGNLSCSLNFVILDVRSSH